MEMNTTMYIIIGLAVLALIFLLMWIMAIKSKQKALTKTQNDFETSKNQLKTDFESQDEKNRIAYKKELAEQKEQYERKISDKDAHIESLKLYSKDKGEYLTDLALIQFRNRLVQEQRIRYEDMLIMANIYLPGQTVKATDKLDHLVMTRTGIYLIDSNYFTGHIFHGINHHEFAREPMFESLFEVLKLDPQDEHSFILENNEGNAQFRLIDKAFVQLKERAIRLQQELNLPYPVTPIMYFDGEGYSNDHVSNFATDQTVKISVGKYELEHFFEKFVFHGRFQYKVEELEAIREKLEDLNP